MIPQCYICSSRTYTERRMIPMIVKAARSATTKRVHKRRALVACHQRQTTSLQERRNCSAPQCCRRATSLGCSPPRNGARPHLRAYAGIVCVVGVRPSRGGMLKPCRKLIYGRTGRRPMPIRHYSASGSKQRLPCARPGCLEANAHGPPPRMHQ